MRLSREDYATIRCALRRAIEWEESLSDSWAPTRTDPKIMCKEEQQCQEMIRRFRALWNKVK